MNRIEELGKDYKNLPKILNSYIDDLDSAKEKIESRGKLDEALNKNSAWLYYYDQRKAEIHALVKALRAEEDRVRSKLFVSYKENYSRSLNSTEINKYIDGEKDYLKVHEILIEVEALFEQYQAITNALMTRHYALSNITKIRVSDIENMDI